MEIILLHDVDKVGRRGQAVNVADGYARNFLFPQGLAVRANTAKKKELEHQLRVLEARDERDRKAAAALATTMGQVSVQLSANASEEDRLYGSITAQMVAAALVAKGYEVEARQVELSEPIKALGSYTVPLRLHRDVRVEVQVQVVRA
jgi:large subunit ribosomal protein L9